jgi:hypothetical protein
MISPEQWRKEPNAKIDQTELVRLRANTHTGRPLGPDTFPNKLEKQLAQKLHRLPLGRPKEKQTETKNSWLYLVYKVIRMPNDDYVSEEERLPDVKAFFTKISGVLNRFAHAHNLRIEKYYHDIPGWEFLFRHPEGGRCYIEVLKKGEQYVTLLADWSVYEYDEGTAYDKHTHRITHSIVTPVLEAGLRDVLKLVLSWSREDLKLIAKRSGDFKEGLSREDFEKDLERYPVPKID